MTVGTQCGNVWWGIGTFGAWDRRLQEENGTSRKTNEVKSSAFMSAHSAMMEVLGVAGKVQYHQRFSSKGLRDIRCMFCMMVFDSHEVQKKHIISCHWTVFEATVSIC